MPRLTDNAYGKDHVRLTKVVRSGPDKSLHTLFEFNVQILLEGAFEKLYTHGDNAACIPTDTMKNTVFALGKKDFDSPEAFAKILATHFLEKFPHVNAATISIEQILWDRIPHAGKPHDHAFAKSSNALRTATVHQSRSSPALITGGITELEVIKTTKSGFVGYIVDPFTTLKPTTDRIFGTSVTAIWTYTPPSSSETDFNSAFHTAQKTILDIFATHDSLGVQQTIYAMGEAVLAAVPAITKIAFTMPNQHRLLVNLEPFGMTNQNEIFVSTPEPFGLIQGTVARD